MEEAAAIEMVVAVTVKMAVACRGRRMVVAVTVKTVVACRGHGTAAAVHRGRRTVLERMSAYECGFQGQLYMGHYNGYTPWPNTSLVYHPMGVQSPWASGLTAIMTKIKR
jgi:hypothetical protein